MPIPSADDFPTAVVTLDDVKAALQIPSEDTSQDSQLQRYIGAATDYVNFISGTIIPQVFTNETHSGGAAQIVLFNAPVLQVASVTEWVGLTPYTLTVSERGGAVETYGYSVDNADQGVISRVWSGVVGPFVAGVNNIVVTYTAGLASIPDDVFLAVIQDIQGLWSQSQNGGRPDVNGGDSTGSWSSSPINAFPRLNNLLTGNRKVQTIA